MEPKAASSRVRHVKAQPPVVSMDPACAQVNPMGNGLYANIHANRAAGKPPRKKGAKGAPTDAAFAKAALTAKKPKAKPKPAAKKRIT